MVLWWTGRGTACDSEMRLFQPGCIVLQNQIMHQSDKKKKKKAADLLHRVAEMEHLATLHGMTDLLDQENIICKSMQLKFGRINHLKAAVAGHCEWLQKRYIQPRYVLGGPHMGALYYAMNEQPSSFGTCQFSYQGVKIRGANLGALELATNTLRTAAKFLLHGANKRFPDVEVISALGIFEPIVIRSRIHEDGFGDAEIAILAKQFGGTLCTMNLQAEWHYLREFLRYRVVGILGKDGQSFWQPLLYEFEQGGVYPDCVVMLELWLCSVHLSPECERIFRDVSQIRSRFRKALHIRTVEILVEIWNNTPQDVLEFNLVGAAARWMRLKNRAKLCFDGDLSNMSYSAPGPKIGSKMPRQKPEGAVCVDAGFVEGLMQKIKDGNTSGSDDDDSDQIRANASAGTSASAGTRSRCASAGAKLSRRCSQCECCSCS